jgi:transposase-like protein
MPITPTNPFKGGHFERGVEVDPSCIWRWVQAYAPELNKRCRPNLKPTNKSYRTNETYISQRQRRVSTPSGGFDR